MLNPPYLLFYPDRNNDDVPDGDPDVHLEGFGLEDTHSVANSLRWGPDGWLYAAQGSTVTGDVQRPGATRPPVHSMGQLIWRYHPETKRYEIFAEGGGNAFGVEIDAKGRVFSGHNGGDTRGFHYVQGGYSAKGLRQARPALEPVRLRLLRGDEAPRSASGSRTRSSIYEGDALPERYRGKLFGVAPLLHHVVMQRLNPTARRFKTKDIGSRRWRPPTRGSGRSISSSAPTAPSTSPTGMTSSAITHAIMKGRSTRPRAASIGSWRQTRSRRRREDLCEIVTRELVDLLGQPKPWQRQTALRLLGDRKDVLVSAAARAVTQPRAKLRWRCCGPCTRPAGWKR